MPKCRFCQREIIWVRSTDPKSTKPIPLDARPTTAFRRTGPELGEPIQVHLNHWVTCTQRQKAAEARDTKAAAEQARTEAQMDALKNRVKEDICDCEKPARSTHRTRGTICTACNRRVRSLDDCCSGCGNTYRSTPCGDVHAAVADHMRDLERAHQ
jgi:hypothetical protein